MPRRPKVLLLAEAANPEWTSVPLVGFHVASAMRAAADTLVVTQIRNREALLRVGWREGQDFVAIDSERVARPLHRVATVLGLGSGRAWSLSTALASFAYLYFERLVWRTLGDRIQGREFDVVHRVTPVSPATPSPIAGHCARAGVPFVLGPLNGGLSWPKGFGRERWREGEYWSALRFLRRLVPGSQRTWRDATAILVGSQSARREVPARFRGKAVAMPENGIHGDAHPEPVARPRRLPLAFAFAGRLVPCKGLELGIEALLPLLGDGRATVTIYGQGPERRRLEAQVAHAGVGAAVHFAGWLPQEQLLAELRTKDVFLFPSIREFGGGALLEAMACGLYPVVLDYGGPPEITADAGCRIPLGSRESIVAAIREHAEALCREPSRLDDLGRAAWQRAMELTWQAKAEAFVELYGRLG
jgi:glycosyltransferase involved in cell wall biosynthesis